MVWNASSGLLLKYGMLLFVHYLAHLIRLHIWRCYLITQFDGYHGLDESYSKFIESQ